MKRAILYSILILLLAITPALAKGPSFTGGGATGDGTGDVTKVGTPVNHQWSFWTGNGTLGTKTITASKPVCSDASGDPAVCAGTEGVWQVAGSYMPSTWIVQAGANNVLTYTGNFTLGLTLTGNTSLTLPTTGTLLAADGDGSSLTGLQFDQFITQTAWRVFYSDGSGDVQELEIGASGKVLKSNGATSAPSWEDDANSGSATAINDIADAAGDGTIAQTGYKQIWTSTLNTAGAVWTMTNTTADLTSDVSFIDFKYTDNGDANGYFLRGYDAESELKWSIGADGAATFGALTATSLTTSSSADPTITLTDSDTADGTAKIYGKTGGDNDVTMTFYVEVAGSDTAYLTLDGATATATITPPTTFTGDITVSGGKITFGNAETIDNETNGEVKITSPVTKMMVDADAYMSVTVADGAGATIGVTSDGADDLNIGDGTDDQPRVRMTLNATDATWSGNTLYFAQCAATMAFGAPAYIQSTGKPGLADADAAATMPAIGLVVVASTDADTPCTILTHGVITDTDWNWTPGNTIYVADGDAGAITATIGDISDENDVVQVMGIAIHADSIFVNPSLATAVLAAP